MADTGLTGRINTLTFKAERLLAMQPTSVMEKNRTPQSGTKHDYMSQAPYFWYDSSKPNGLPYLRKDGQRNPEIYTIADRRFIGELDDALRILALSWFLTGNPKYAAKAALLLRHWFLDDSTYMNPNLEFAQAVPGVNNGRGIGIIESISLMGMADAACLLEGSSAWTKKDARDLQQWYARYLNWMLTSHNGKEEHAAKNNHGTWYLTQVIDFALFAGDLPRARQLAEEGKMLVDSQIRADGKMPLELERTNALSYSTYNLQAFFSLCTACSKAGVDLWHYRNQAGAGIRTALDWLLPFALGNKKWNYQEISPYHRNDFYVLLLQASDIYDSATYREAAAVTGEKGNEITALLLAK